MSRNNEHLPENLYISQNEYTEGRPRTYSLTIDTKFQMNKSQYFYVVCYDNNKRKWIRRDGHFVSTNKSNSWFRRHVVHFLSVDEANNYCKYLQTIYKEYPQYSFDVLEVNTEKE